MSAPNFAQDLRAGRLLIGTLVSLPSPEVAEILRNTEVEVLDNLLKVSTTLSPEVVVSALEEV